MEKYRAIWSNTEIVYGAFTVVNDHILTANDNIRSLFLLYIKIKYVFPLPTLPLYLLYFLSFIPSPLLSFDDVLEIDLNKKIFIYLTNPILTIDDLLENDLN